LEVALDRIGDAEGGAIALLDQNTELFSENQKIRSLAVELRDYAIKLERKQKLQPWVYSIGGVAFVAGGVIIGDGISDPDKPDLTKIGVGAGIIAIDFGVWALGHWLFSWW
jgi:hypothetical protein